jgi:hypothetical protein
MHFVMHEICIEFASSFAVCVCVRVCVCGQTKKKPLQGLLEISKEVLAAVRRNS